MKKIIIIIFFISLLSSCTKDYTCTCSLTFSNGNPATVREKKLLDIRRSDAKRVCVNYTEEKNGITTTGVCSLK